MRIAVLGAGMMGRAAVWFLSRAEGVTEVRVFDRDADMAENVAKTYGNGIAAASGLDVLDGTATRRALSGCAAALGAVSYKVNVLLSEACLDVGCHFNDLGGNNTIVERQFGLSDKARAANVAIVPDTGLAPGLGSVLVAGATAQVPGAHTAHIRCGGLPLHPKPPFGYQLVFSVEGLINEYKEPTWVLREGQPVEVPTLYDVEELEFPAPFGRLEAFNTSGGLSTLPWTFAGRLRNIDYKTIRYPGHIDLVQKLFALGLFDEEPIVADGARVNPRRVSEARLARAFAGDGPDVVLMLVEAVSDEKRFAYRIIDRKDERTGLTAMMRCTSFPAAAITHMLASGLITERGTLHQELVVPIAPFLKAIRERGIEVEEIVG